MRVIVILFKKGISSPIVSRFPAKDVVNMVKHARAMKGLEIALEIIDVRLSEFAGIYVQWVTQERLFLRLI